MEEKKEKKKISKVYIVIFSLAIVSAILGVFDLKANAAELTDEVPYLNVTYSNYWNENYPYSVPDGYIYPDFDGHFQTYELDNTRLYALMRIPQMSSDGTIICYYYSLYNGDGVGYFTNNEQPCSYVPTTYNQYKYVKNGTDTFNDTVTYSTSDSTFTVYVAPELEVNNSRIVDSTFETNIPIFEDYNAMTTYLKTGVLEGNIIDYDSFPIDDEMPVIENLKRNVIKNSVSNPLGVELSASETWDLISWTNTSDKYQLELQTVPIVQFYKISLPDNKFIKEYYGEWETKEIFNVVTNKYKNFTNTTNEQFIYENANAYHFYHECGEKYSTSAFEDKFLYFGYRLRYIDVENGRKGPWVTLIPEHSFDSYTGYVSYSDDTTSDLGNLNGTVNEYVDMENIEDAIQDIETENHFKDKYETVDNQADVQEVSNWLKTVVNFISGTPSVVGSVLSFLPQPILYGLYITIFLGVIASGIAIIRALI